MKGGIDITVVDLFCGCGGLSQGFLNAGFEVLAGFEHWKLAISCYQRNFSHPVEDVDLSDVTASVERITKYSPEIIIGGPPCQDFSGAGKRIEGERAELTVSYAKIISQITPRYFVMENVERAYHSEAYKKARKIFKDSGYGLTEKVLDASFCGVPQKRKRFFCIGLKDGEDGFLYGLLAQNQSICPLTVREYFFSKHYKLEIEHYYRHPRSYKRRGIFSIDEPSPTIRGVNRPKPEGYIKHPGDKAEPKNIRNLTTLERALIQTFPYDFKWTEPMAATEQMIGNAVPVNLANYVARCLKEFIDKGEKDNNDQFIKWLKEEHKLTIEEAGDIIYGTFCAGQILPFEDILYDSYLNTLGKQAVFSKLTDYHKLRIKRACKLYYEYRKACTYSIKI